MPTATAPDGAAIAYEVSGNGPALLLAHGITESRRSWDPLIGPLAEDHRVIAVDLRGHGESGRLPPYDALTMVGDLRAVVDAVGATDPLVVGHSLGGAVVSLYAAVHPVRAVINVDQPLELSGFKGLVLPLEPMLTGNRATFDALMKEMFASFYGPLPPAELARLAAASHPEQEVVLGVWDLVLHATVEELDELTGNAAAAIAVPYLSLHGSDPGAAYAEWLTSAVPTATVEVWPDHGHYPHLLEPDRFLDRVREFSGSVQ